MSVEVIRVINAAVLESSHFPLQSACCVILTHDNKILMQYRPKDWLTYPNCLATFGGHIEDDESAIDGIIRELAEELGAKVRPEELSKLGVITEEITQHKELVHVYFWRDYHNTITGCYEAEDRRFETIDEVLLQPETMDYVRWSLKEAQKNGLLK